MEEKPDLEIKTYPIEKDKVDASSKTEGQAEDNKPPESD